MGSRLWPFVVTWRHWSRDHLTPGGPSSYGWSIVTMRPSGTVTELWRLKDNRVTSLISWVHVTSSVTWPFDSRGSTSAAPFKGRKWSSEKIDLGGYDFTTRFPWLVDQSSPNFFTQRGGNSGTKCTYPISNIFIRFGDIHRRTLKSSKIAPNFACFGL